jgi:xylulokinase
VLPHLEAGLWNIGSIIPASGRLFAWFKTLTGQEERSNRKLAEELIAFPSPDGAWFLQEERPRFFPGTGGQCVSFRETGTMNRQGLGRAVLEAMGFLARDALETLGRHGFPVREMRVSGGQGTSPWWNQLKADLTGRTLLIPEILDGELAGDAVLAAIALGESADLPEAVSRMIRMSARYDPTVPTQDAFTEQYRRYGERKARFHAAL